MSKKITFLTLFLWLMTVTFPVIAQQKTDTTYTFRFVPQKDMFYVPWNGNDTELARLLECIENNKATILDGKLPLLVDGYCNSLGGEAENLATAKIRANRVKSELITRAKIKEENFITHNHATEGDFVTVRLTVPVKETAVTDAEAEARRKAEAERYSDVGPVMIQGIMFLFVMALLLFGFTKAFGGNIMRLLVSSESIYEGTMEFLDWRIYGFFFSFINVMFRALYIGITRTKVLTINAIVMALTNVVLDYVLIFGKFGLPEMGIKGAAIASVLAEASSILFFVIYTYATVDLKKYGMNRLRTFDPALLMRILSISCFTMLQYFLSMATWFVFFVAVERLGQRELAIANIVRSIYVVLLIPVNALATTTNSLVSNAIGAGGIQHVMPLINKIARFSFFIMLGLVAVSALFPQFLLSIYTSEAALITESVPSVYVICCAMLIASVANVVFNGISGTGNTQAALLLETITIIIYGSYIIFIGMWLKAPIEICFTIEIVYYSLLLITSYIYLKKAKWQNKKI